MGRTYDHTQKERTLIKKTGKTPAGKDYSVVATKSHKTGKIVYQKTEVTSPGKRVQKVSGSNATNPLKVIQKKGTTPSGAKYTSEITKRKRWDGAPMKESQAHVEGKGSRYQVVSDAGNTIRKNHPQGPRKK